MTTKETKEAKETKAAGAQAAAPIEAIFDALEERVAKVQGRHQGVARQGGISNLCQLDEPRAAGEAASKVRRGPDRQPGLADTARSDQADQAGGRQLLAQLGDLAAPADEAGRFGRQVAGPASGPGHGQGNYYRQRSGAARRSGGGSVIPRISCAPGLPSLRVKWLTTYPSSESM